MKHLLIVAMLALAGCEQSPPVDAPTVKVTGGKSRFSIEVVGRFETGHDGRDHDIIILTDTETGATYFAVQGFGSPQMVSERAGKTTVSRER